MHSALVFGNSKLILVYLHFRTIGLFQQCRLLPHKVADSNHYSRQSLLLLLRRHGQLKDLTVPHRLYR
ncbi:hypothetical protein MHA_2053 [Mannheimia haemolytica PHL213]|nr:hypothetical protein MHA_2053 [Mannheimia haemolytica PHL213]